MCSGRHKLAAGGTHAAQWWPHTGSPGLLLPLQHLRGDGWWDTRRADEVWIWRLGEHFDWPVFGRLTGEGAADVLPVKRRIANTVDGDWWKKGWKSGGVKERPCESEVKKRWRKGIWRATEEEKRWKYEEILARKWQKETEAGGQRSEGYRVRGLSPSGSWGGCNLTSRSS